MVGRSELRLFQLAVVLVLGGAAVTILLILSGLFDPKPIGSPAWSVEPGEVQVASGSRQVEWLEDAPALPPAYTLRLTAALNSGELDSSYGLVVGTPAEMLLIAVSPLGYVTIEHGDESLFPWQTWPHIRTGEQANEIWLDVRPSGAASEITVRLNRELLWSGELALSGAEVGFMVESFGEAAIVDFQQLTLYR